MRSLFFTIAILLFGQALLAVETSVLKEDSAIRYPKNLVSVDAFPMIFRGVGMGYDRVIKENLSLGVNFTEETLRANNSGDNSMKIQAVGVRTRYFVAGDATEKGWYLGASVVSVNLKTTVRVLPTDQEGMATDRKTGFVGQAGYQIRGNDYGGGRFLLNLGLLTGTGLGAKFQARSTSGVSNVNTSIESGLGAEATLGFIF